MTQLTERYLAAALRGIPESQRSDVERELRSSIADALEDRVSGGEDDELAEKAVLEGLGDPVRLAAGISGRPLHLIGPDLFVEYRRLLVMLLSIVMPIVGVVQVAVQVAGGEDWIGAIVAGIGAAWTVGLHIFFWVTIIFAFVERVDAAREARDEITKAAGHWTVERLPALPAGRVTAGETVGEIVTVFISIGGILFLTGANWFTDASGDVIPVFNPEVWSTWMPILIGALVAQALLQIVIFLVGRWTMPIAAVHALLQLAFAVPVTVLALTGSLINPAFTDAIGWPPLADGNGPAMLALAAVTVLVTGWEIFDGFRRARRAGAINGDLAGFGERGQAAR
jgi:hypothetical protein